MLRASGAGGPDRVGVCLPRRVTCSVVGAGDMLRS